MLITSMQWHPDIHYGMTTVNDIMNIGRGINAGKIVFYTDGTFGICKHDVCLVGVRGGKDVMELGQLAILSIQANHMRQCGRHMTGWKRLSLAYSIS